MENVMTKGFCELNEQEMMEVDGGMYQGKNPFVNFYLGLKNDITRMKNAVVVALKPSTGEMPSGYDWTIY
ncbi:MAG: hypothetical protein IJ007_06810 [Oscillospiraceae bacterium]|nr:hypothetical protein [Oscillospiraceae bacterium]